MDECCFCGSLYPQERTELGYEWCMKCAEERPVLARPDFVVLGQHKAQPLVMSREDPLVIAKVSYMNR